MECHHQKNGLSNPWKTIAILVFVVGGGYYLWMQHKAHVLQYLPVLIFLLCPLMHLFGGHGGHGGHSHGNSKKENQK